MYIKYPMVTNLPFLSYIFSFTKCSNSPSEAVKRRKPSVYSSLGQLCALHKVVKARRLAGLWSCGWRTGLHCTDSVIAVCCTLLKAVCVPSGKPKLKHKSLLPTVWLLLMISKIQHLRERKVDRGSVLAHIFMCQGDFQKFLFQVMKSCK